MYHIYMTLFMWLHDFSLECILLKLPPYDLRSIIKVVYHQLKKYSVIYYFLRFSIINALVFKLPNGEMNAIIFGLYCRVFIRQFFYSTGPILLTFKLASSLKQEWIITFGDFWEIIQNVYERYYSSMSQSLQKGKASHSCCINEIITALFIAVHDDVIKWKLVDFPHKC